ncbi:hypothetical protein ILUMI_23714 [Ignelater luminosus]|uniref:[histone H4]-lysine(20) N-methyltransferase n=1 Tax=Ignelater luminosus TaxID=2038154 RepID=A0A8K0C8D3_IGNLU|nr:hypothetical protein ILUMI_23714 [Ignelater luminosus]
MVRGRRVKTVIADTCSNNGDCYSPKRKNGRLEQNKSMTTNVRTNHCITKYFSIKCLPQNLEDAKVCNFSKAVSLDVDCPSIIASNVGVDEDINIIKDTYLGFHNDKAFENVFIPPSPHRIELCTEISHPKDLKLQPKNESNVKCNTKKILKSKLNNKTATDHKVTEYFPVRRSVRKTKQTILEEKQRQIEKLLKSGVEDGLQVQSFEGKGRGVVALQPFQPGDFVVEYSGELLDVAQARERERIYAQDLNTGCYMYYFKFQNQQFCVDATAESGRLGRLVNHSRNGNLITRTVVVDGLPRLVLIAKENIKIGDEISYDYGDRSKESLKHHPWLAF